MKNQAKVRMLLPCLYSLSCFRIAYENRLVICLHWLFSLANPDRGVAFHIYYSPFLCSFFSDVDDVIRYLSQNLYQHGTITVNLANVYKCKVVLQGFVLCVWCSSDYAFYFPARVLCVRLCVPLECVLKEHRDCVCVCVCGRVELRVS